MVNIEAQGAVGAPFEVHLEVGKIREFAAATGSTNEAYWRPDAPVVPPTFLTTARVWSDWAGAAAQPWELVEMDPGRGMQAEQEFEFYGALPRGGQVLRAQTRIGDIVTKRGQGGQALTFVTEITEFWAENGELVAKAVMTGVEVGTPDGQEGR